MIITEYTPARAEALRNLEIPEITLPVHIKVLWVSIIDSYDSSIYLDVHSHSFFEIHFVFSGEVTYEHAGKISVLRKGDALFIPPNSMHRFVKYSDHFLKCSLAFRVEQASAFSSCLSAFRCETFGFSSHISDQFNFILKQGTATDLFSPILIGNRILEIIYSLCKEFKLDLPAHPATVTDTRFEIAVQYIKNNSQRLISCEDIAKEVCLSRKHLSRLFKKYTGKSLNEYLICQRLEYANRLVLQTEYSIKQISFMLGFQNECSFIAFFKQHFGLSPGAYRIQKLYNGSNKH